MVGCASRSRGQGSLLVCFKPRIGSPIILIGSPQIYMRLTSRSFECKFTPQKMDSVSLAYFESGNEYMYLARIFLALEQHFLIG